MAASDSTAVGLQQAIPAPAPTTPLHTSTKRKRQHSSPSHPSFFPENCESGRNPIDTRPNITASSSPQAKPSHQEAQVANPSTPLEPHVMPDSCDAVGEAATAEEAKPDHCIGSPRTRVANQFAVLHFGILKNGGDATTKSASELEVDRDKGEKEVVVVVAENDFDGGAAEDDAGNWTLDQADAEPPSSSTPPKQDKPTHIDSTTSATSSSGTPTKRIRTTYPTPSPTPKRTKSPPLIDANAISSLTWHTSEITGHLALSPDDDGRGLNGLGFRPTKLEAQRREARRKEQVERWKRGVAKEERWWRGERRKREKDGYGRVEDTGGDDPGKKRVVRFADATS